MRERVKCKKCGQFMKSATGFGGMPMDEQGLVTFIKMLGVIQKDGEPLGDDGVRCAGCGAGLSHFVIEEVP